MRSFTSVAALEAAVEYFNESKGGFTFGVPANEEVLQLLRVRPV